MRLCRRLALGARRCESWSETDSDVSIISEYEMCQSVVKCVTSVRWGVVAGWVSRWWRASTTTATIMLMTRKRPSARQGILVPACLLTDEHGRRHEKVSFPNCRNRIKFQSDSEGSRSSCIPRPPLSTSIVPSHFKSPITRALQLRSLRPSTHCSRLAPATTTTEWVMK